MSRLSAIVLAAGQGTRMRSSLPKPAHRLCGRPMVNWILGAVDDCDADVAVVVVGHGADKVEAAVRSETFRSTIAFARQRTQRGTGDAAMVGLNGLISAATGRVADDTDLDSALGFAMDDTASVIVAPGDTPLLRGETLRDFVDEHRANDSVCTILTAEVPDATGYGRIIRNSRGSVERIVEHRDATADERAVNEINTGIFCFRQALLAPALRKITPNNAQGEFYLTDVVSVLRAAGYPIHAHVLPSPDEANGVNDRSQLIDSEQVLRARINRRWLESGVSIIDPIGTPIDHAAVLGTDITIDVGCTIRGATVIGDGATIGPGTDVIDAQVGDGAQIIRSHVGAGAAVGANSTVGPFAVIEPGTTVADGAIVSR